MMTQIFRSNINTSQQLFKHWLIKSSLMSLCKLEVNMWSFLLTPALILQLWLQVYHLNQLSSKYLGRDLMITLGMVLMCTPNDIVITCALTMTYMVTSLVCQPTWHLKLEDWPLVVTNGHDDTDSLPPTWFNSDSHTDYIAQHTFPKA